MDDHQMIWNEAVAKQIIHHLEKRRMEGSYAPNAAQSKGSDRCNDPAGRQRLSLRLDDNGRNRLVGEDS